MLRLIDILTLQGIDLGQYKIHFATESTASTSPLDAFRHGAFKDWQEDQTSKNFGCKNVAALISLGDDRWLFVGVYRVLSVAEVGLAKYKYQTELIQESEGIVGRVIVRFKKDFRNCYVWGAKYGDRLEVTGILSIRLSDKPFDGFNRVLLRFSELSTLVKQQEASWRSALSSVSGVYLILDTATGKPYVGSAYGNGGIWQRWSCYTQTWHGNNIEFKDLIASCGPEYFQNFQFSILEVLDPLATQEQVCNRESHWKDVLMSRTYGYNCN